MNHRRICILALAIGTTVCLTSIRLNAADPVGPASGAPAKAEPLHLLTYDHGGLVLWGHEHFAERLGRVSTNPCDGSSGFLHEQKLRFKLFPATSESAVGVRDLPFAIAETTRRYVEGHYWNALTDGQAGLAVFNRGTMGSVRETDGGFSVPLAFAMYDIWGTRMIDGDFAYEFALYPFTGDWRQHDLHRRALEYNFPVVSVSTAPGRGTLGAEVRLLDVGAENILLSAPHPERGRVLARLFECQGRVGEAAIASANGAARLEEVDLLGENPRPVASPLSVKPWQIQTVRLVEERKGETH